MVINRRRLSKVHTTSISPGIKPLNAGHRQNGWLTADSKMSPISKGRRFWPQIGSIGPQICHFPWIVAAKWGKKYINVHFLWKSNSIIWSAELFALLFFFKLLAMKLPKQEAFSIENFTDCISNICIKLNNSLKQLVWQPPTAANPREVPCYGSVMLWGSFWQGCNYSYTKSRWSRRFFCTEGDIERRLNISEDQKILLDYRDLASK